MEKWQEKWMAQHPDASLQEFAVALSQRMTRTSVALMAGVMVGAILLPIYSVVGNVHV